MITAIQRFFSWIFSIKRVRQRAEATHLTPAENRKQIGRRLFFLTLLVFLVFVLRLSWLVVTHHVAGTNILDAAKANVTYTSVLHPKRGTIYDRTGSVIAEDSQTYTIYVTLDKNFKDINGKKLYAEDKEFPTLVQFLSDQLGIPTDLAKSQLESKKAQVQFGTNGTNIPYSKRDEIVAAAKDKGLKGIGFSPILARSYPNGIFSSHLIGTAQLKNPGDESSGLIGVSGIEATLDPILSGKKGKITTEKDMYGRAIPGATVDETPAVNGQDVYTSLDVPLQVQLEQLMDGLQQETGAQQMSAVLMEAKSGDILAASQRPTYNPQDMAGIKDPGFTYQNLMYEAQYEPGSTMKSFLVASAMDSGNWDSNATYVRKLNLYDVTIDDWDMNENGHYSASSSMTAAQGFAFSSNTIMSQIEMKMGYATWSKYLKRFMFGLPVRMGLGTASETSGTLPADNKVTEVMSSFGQGIAVSQLQMLRGWTSFANKGTMLEPHFINKIVNTNTNTVLQGEPEIIGQPITEDTAGKILPLMETVNTDPNYGTANNLIAGNSQNADPLFVVNGQPAAVKTGTAQVADPNTGSYLQGKNETLNSAVVIYPVTSPDYVFYIYVKLPTSYSLTLVANVSNAMISLAESRKTQLDETATSLKNGQVQLKNYFGEIAGPTEAVMRRYLLQPVVIGTGNKIKSQSIKAGTRVYANQRILLLTDGDPMLPDMRGWNKSDVSQLAKWYNLSITYRGKSGVVTKQSMEADTPVNKGDKVTVTLGE